MKDKRDIVKIAERKKMFIFKTKSQDHDWALCKHKNTNDNEIWRKKTHTLVPDAV